MLQRDLLRARRVSLDAYSKTVPGLIKEPIPPLSPQCSGRPATHTGMGLSPLNPPKDYDEAICVAVRCRPIIQQQGEAGYGSIVSMNPTEHEIFVSGQETHSWKVDIPLWSDEERALDGSAPTTQEDVYQMIGKPLLQHALEGYNSTLLAYGQTGSGKTYTMMGRAISMGTDEDNDQTEEGIIPRLCRDLFKKLQEGSYTSTRGEAFSWEVHVRYIEIYCERISDLLNHSAPVSLREEVTATSAKFALLGTRRIKVTTTEDILAALRMGNKCRKTASTRTNDRSSRSHAIFMIDLMEMLTLTESNGATATATSKSLTIRLVDLAGSERVGETGVTGRHLKEAREINLSLFTLGLVIEALSDPKRRGKPPYRDSVLTKLLRDSFGGNSKTTMICNISPSPIYRNQTIQTLNYACKARRVFNRPCIEVDPSAVELRRANEELTKLRKELLDAKNQGVRNVAIEQQFREAQERLRREQEESMKRKAALEEKEAELADRLRQLEEQRSRYEEQMLSMEEEVDRAHTRQLGRERELQRARLLAEEKNKKRMKELEEQQRESESDLKEKEREILRKQRAVEERLRELEEASKRRIKELLRQQDDMDAELRSKEKLAKEREEALLHKQAMTEGEARRLELKAAQQEQESLAKIRAVEEAARAREEAIRKMNEDAQERIRSMESNVQNMEEEAHLRLREANEKAARIQAESAAKQEELDRRIAELNRQAQDREQEHQSKLQHLEFELKKRDRESAKYEEELNALRNDAARRTESAKSREKSLEIQQAAITDSIQKKEAYLKRREEELDAQFQELMKWRKDWEKEHSERLASLDSAHDSAVAVAKEKENLLLKKENDLRSRIDELDMKNRASEMEIKRKEMELMALENERNADLNRERRALEKLKRELEMDADKAKADQKLQDERMQRWEDDLKNRRSEVERILGERQDSLLNREKEAQDTLFQVEEKERELAQMAARLKEEQEEMDARKKYEETEKLRAIEQQEYELSVKHRDLENTNQRTESFFALRMQDLQAREGLFLLGKERFHRQILTMQESTERDLLVKSFFTKKEVGNLCNALKSEEERNKDLRRKLEQVEEEKRQILSKQMEKDAHYAAMEGLMQNHEKEIQDLNKQGDDLRRELHSLKSSAEEELSTLRTALDDANFSLKNEQKSARYNQKFFLDTISICLRKWMSLLIECELRERYIIEQSRNSQIPLLRIYYLLSNDPDKHFHNKLQTCTESLWDEISRVQSTDIPVIDIQQYENMRRGSFTGKQLQEGSLSQGGLKERNPNITNTALAADKQKAVPFSQDKNLFSILQDKISPPQMDGEQGHSHSITEASKAVINQGSDAQFVKEGLSVEKKLGASTCVGCNDSQNHLISNLEDGADIQNGQKTFPKDQGDLESLNRRMEELRKLEGDLVLQEARLSEQIAEFLLQKRAFEVKQLDEETRIKRYLIEIEEEDRERQARYTESERELVSGACKLKEKESLISKYIFGTHEALVERAEREVRQAISAQEEIEWENIFKVFLLNVEKDLYSQMYTMGPNGADDGIKRLLHFKEDMLQMEERRFDRKREKIDEDKKERFDRLVAEEEVIKKYLKALEGESIQRQILSDQGKARLKEAERRIAEAEAREAAIEERTHRLRKEALRKEEELRALEERFQEQAERGKESILDRTAKLEERQREADSIAEDAEKTLLQKEADLQAITSKNDETRRFIAEKEEEIKRQKQYFVDLTGLLKERERLLRIEHAHRLDGKDSAIWLTDDLLDVNDELKKQLAIWMQKYRVLKSEGKIECEQCSWQNKRTATQCLCCGFSPLE